MRASKKLLFFISIFSSVFSYAKTNSLKDYESIIVKLNETGTAYSNFSLATQFWFRHSSLNPGTTNIVGDPVDHEFDFALRRTRFSIFNKLNEKITVYTQFGFNNFNASSSKPSLYFHDVWAMYDICDKSMSIGFGLSGCNGISRLTNASFKKMQTLDNPGFNIPSVNHTDLESRQLGLFVKGTARRLNYRAAVTKPMVYDGLPEQVVANKGYEYPSGKLEYKGYFAWHFLEKEYFKTTYVSMTYLGTKRICNLGAGFDVLPGAVAEFDEDENMDLKNRVLLSADFFMEIPFNRNQAFSVYAVYYNYDFGKNYLRSSGVMNIWDGGTSVEGAGNAEFKVGTGNIWYGTFAYLLPQNFVSKVGRLQLYYACSRKDFQAIPYPFYNYDIGANLFVNGHKLKLSVDYSLRPVSMGGDLLSGFDHLGTFIFQTQIVI